MFSFNSHSKILLAVEPVDLRKNFAGLWALAAETLGVEPRSDSVFVFTNRAHSRVKILAWDGTGVWVCAKRLEKGTFAWPRNTAANRSHRAAAATAAPRVKIRIEPTALVMLLDGFDLREGCRRPWFERE
jgi:transposase